MKACLAMLGIVILFCASSATAQDTGAEVYKSKCAMCHGPNGEGKVGPALKSTKLGEDDIVLLLSKGKERKKAPHNKPKAMSDEDIKAVAHYVKSLK
jgi:cytochrome c6